MRTLSRQSSDFSRLAERISDAGLLDRRPWRAAGTASLAILALVAGWTAFFLVGDSWWQLAIAAVLAVAFGQVAFLGHDVGHRQVFRTRRASEAAGRAGNLLIGLGFGWWVDKHTRHHANPNHLDRDPDVGPGVLSWTPEQARGGGVIARWQGYLFFPLCLLEGVNLQISGVRSLRTVKRPLLEGGLLAGHFAFYVGSVFLVLPPLKALAFIAVHHGLWGLYMGAAFAPNHKGMPLLTAADKLDFLRRQVLTSRNVSGGRLVDVLLGGLNHQIEHHLFPSMPRANLRRARPIVRAYCAEIGVPYVECGPLESYGLALRHLHDAGADLRRHDPPDNHRKASV